MLSIPPTTRVYAYVKPADMRKSFSGLVGILEQELGQQVESGGLFLFFNRRHNSVKVLFFTGDGLAIFYRRLERGTFELPRAAAEANARGANPAGVEIKPSELTLILEGIERESRPIVDQLFASWQAALRRYGPRRNWPKRSRMPPVAKSASEWSSEDCSVCSNRDVICRSSAFSA
jgi:transposase